MAAATSEKPSTRRGRKPRRMFMPYDQAVPAIVQPPAELAHITDEDELFEALTDAAAFERATGHAPAKWYTARFVAEIGRSTGRFKAWMSNHYAVTVHGVDPATIEDRIMVKPDAYDKRSPWWYETTARAWANAEGIMTRRGVFVPYKPTGRPAGRKDSVPRQRTATMKASALQFLSEAEKLTAGGAKSAEAKRTLAARYKISERAVSRRLTAGRAMRAAGVREITTRMPAAEVAEIIVVTYRLLMADGRRTNTENAREDVAERLGVDRGLVDSALDGAPAAVLADTDNPHVMPREVAAPAEEPRNYEAERLRAEMEAAILVDNITRGTAPLHPQT